MIIVYESKTGFTKKYADMLAEKTGLKAYRVKELPADMKDEEIIFLGWMKAGMVQGQKLKNNIKRFAHPVPQGPPNLTLKQLLRGTG